MLQRASLNINLHNNRYVVQSYLIFGQLYRVARLIVFKANSQPVVFRQNEHMGHGDKGQGYNVGQMRQIREVTDSMTLSLTLTFHSWNTLHDTVTVVRVKRYDTTTMKYFSSYKAKYQLFFFL